MGRELLDVEEREAVVREDGRHGEEREVREVLVVDRVELVVLHQLQQVRELHRDDAVGREQRSPCRATKSLRSGTCASTLLPSSRSARRALVAEPRRQSRCRRTRPSVGMPALLRRRRDVRRRLDAEHGHRALDEVLEEVAVVAGDLDDLAVDGPRPNRSVTSVDVARVRARASSRERREVRVVAEDVLRRLELGELHEEALARTRRRAAGRTARPGRAASAGR